MLRGRQNSSPTATDSLRPFIFGDRPIEEWPGTDEGDQGEPWASFLNARTALAAGDVAAALSLWQQIADRDDIESRQLIQAWRFLREHGVAPPEQVSRRVLGGVVEVPVGKAHDLLAAYADGAVRYLNHTGSAAVVEPGAATAQLAQAAGAFLDTTRLVAQLAGPWDGPALPPLPPGHSRVTALTPGGIRFGQGPDEQLRGQRPAADMLHAALALLQQVVSVTT